MEKVSVVVVTYNRLACLKKVITCLREQTVHLNNIIVINNGSTDGTELWLKGQEDLNTITQENVGGSGGFYRGIKEALTLENDWIWCMDDDVYPRKDCLSNLLLSKPKLPCILCPKRKQDGVLFLSEYKKLNLTNPFKGLHHTKLTVKDIDAGTPVEIEDMVFEGPLLKREVIENIGLPNKDLFIFYDDSDYSYRAHEAGYKVYYVPNAVMDKEKFNVELSETEIKRKNRWKTWYYIRNTAYFCKTHAKTPMYKLFGGIGSPIHMFLAILFNLICNNKYDFKDLGKVIQMYRRGRKGQLGKI